MKNQDLSTPGLTDTGIYRGNHRGFAPTNPLYIEAVRKSCTLIFFAGFQIATFSIFTLPAATVLKAEVEQSSTVKDILLSDASQQFQRGEQLYQEQKFSEAAKVFQAAAQAFKTQGDTLNQGLALNYLSLAYQRLGRLSEAKSASQESLTLLKSIASDSKDYLSIIAQAYNTQGQLQLSLGQSEEALASWEQATKIYITIGDKAGIIGSQINQAQALQALGQYRRAKIMLTSVNETIEKQPNSLLKASSLLSLGNALRVIGDLDQKDPTLTKVDSLGSRQVLEKALAVAEQVKDPETVAQIQLSLGNTFPAQENFKEALALYQEVANNVSVSPLTQIQAKLNQMHLYIGQKNWSSAQSFLPDIQSVLDKLPPSRETIYARINLAENLKLIAQNQENIPNFKWSDIAQLAANAVREARTLGDRQAEAYALGSLGGLYEQTKQWKEAKSLTQKALNIAQDTKELGIEGRDIAYRLQWQLGRILNDPTNPEGSTNGAIAAYSEAVQTLKFLRNDLVALHRDVQFSFRDDVEPIYRNLVELLLSSEQPTQDNLKQARETIEALQLAELDNFFRDACLQAKPEQVDKIIDQSDSTTAAIYPIILPSKVAVIVKLPQTTDLYYYSTKIENKDVNKLLKTLLEELKKDYPSPEGKDLSQQVYGWLLQRAETQFKNKGVNNLVFVLDGFLRNIPMAALYDGKDYIIKKYGITIAPGLQMIKAKPLTEQNFKVLAAGVSLEQIIDNKTYPEIIKVNTEINQLGEKFKAKILLNQAFTINNFTNQIYSNKFSVVHIATHGEFGSTLERTYIVAWGQLITAANLNKLLLISSQKGSNNIELLILTACETAKGDERATLGIAGLAVRSGARSTLASLWRIDDSSSVILVNEFYKQLKSNPKLTKAEALRQAQIKLLSQPNSDAPYKWAPYILVGNWQ